MGTTGGGVRTGGATGAAEARVAVEAAAAGAAIGGGADHNSTPTGGRIFFGGSENEDSIKASNSSPCRVNDTSKG